LGIGNINIREYAANITDYSRHNGGGENWRKKPRTKMENMRKSN